MTWEHGLLIGKLQGIHRGKAAEWEYPISRSPQGRGEKPSFHVTTGPDHLVNSEVSLRRRGRRVQGPDDDKGTVFSLQGDAEGLRPLSR